MPNPNLNPDPNPYPSQVAMLSWSNQNIFDESISLRLAGQQGEC